ncbi:hypothetical protein GCM10007962_13140 [Yeosuana aromativorans]|uniref:Beta-carotene 15,15'-monooxygenase n=1 Tax=Yeosuana aromativorans TaxID=288019 RepID=A0A8J3BGS5_9FLAO|nr:hypothetical protein [Yeosuana aromativorans]GGK20382.1 hypothetical protein GCM10007962_13140 [Yeosuana aromativorans]
MDELELLKKDWNKKDSDFKKLSSADLYAMLQKKSSSIVKTLFYISIAELLFWIVINSIPYFSSDSYRERLEAIYNNEHIITALTIFSYAVILLFIYLLFKSYKAISVTDSAKKLMESILNTRKVIKYYVIYNLIMAFVSMVVGMYLTIIHDPKLSHVIETFSNKQLIAFIGIIALAIVVFVVIIWLFYKLLYGLLLKRLNQNYKELKKLEV